MGQDIFAAIENSDVAGVEALLIDGADPNGVREVGYHVRPLHAAINAIEEGRSVSTIPLLLHYGADIDKTFPDFFGGTPLLVALYNNLKEVAYLLLARGANPNLRSEEGHVPLCWAVENRDIEMAQTLLQKGAWKEINQYTAEEGRTALGMAIHRLQDDMVRLLLDAGADPRARDFDRRNARDCLPERESGNSAMWDRVSQLLDGTHISPLMSK